MKKDILQFLKDKNYSINEEIEQEVENFSELLDSKERTVDSILKWLDEKKEKYSVLTSEIGVNELEKWYVDEKTGNIYHDSGKFYSIVGVKVEGAEDREVSSWTQPMIKQEECGILGIICKRIDGSMHYLLQAKYEPGNMHVLQLSPTLQATESNLRQAHKGKKPLLSEYFENVGKGKIRASVVSVEDGGRFYKKTNRNMVVEIPENESLEVPDSFIWVNKYQLKKLLKMDTVVNSLTRSILGSI